jgi:hypothetical protein
MEAIFTHKQERELDARVAEKVMQDKVLWVENKPYLATSKDGKQSAGRGENQVPHYSTNLGAAMTVAMQLRRLGFVIDILMDERGTTLTVVTAQGDEVCRFDNIISRFAQYMCHAALIAVGDERRKGEDRRKARRY